MGHLVARLRALRPGARSDEPPSEAFTRDLFTSRLARPAVAVVLVALGVAIGWTWNAVSPAAAVAAGLAVIAAVTVAVVALDRSRWRGQEVIVWQQAGRTRRWVEDTGGPSPNQHPAQAETWLGTHPRGSVPQLYRVLAASVAGNAVIRDRELAALVPATVAEEAWRAWAVVSPGALAGQDVDLAELRRATDALPDGDDRRQLEAALAMAGSLRRHAAGERGWLEPLAAVHPSVSRERLRPSQVFRLWFGRFAILLSCLVPAVALASSGFGAPEPYPRAYHETSIATRGDVGTIDRPALLRALSLLAADVAAHDAVGDVPVDVSAVDALIAEGLPTLIWDVDEVTVPGPMGVGCDRVTSIETLLGSSGAAGGSAIVTCRGQLGVAWIVPLGDPTVAALRAAVGVGR